MHIIVASRNPVKISATRLALETMWPDEAFEVEGFSAPSGVPDQPVGDKETILGARNRTRNAQTAMPDADLWIGIEGGIVKREGSYMTMAWIAVWDGKHEGLAQSAAFQLPPAVCKLLDEGFELGDADDRVFGSNNSKQAGGALGLLTQNKLTRTGLYRPAIMMALIPFYNEELFEMKNEK
ncbi:MAG: inosine/xanthosine triphosphatase [Bacteroidia bacterium]